MFGKFGVDDKTNVNRQHKRAKEINQQKMIPSYFLSKKYRF